MIREELKDLVDFAVKYGRDIGADYSEARLHLEQGKGLSLRNGVPEPPVKVLSCGIAIRTAYKGALSFSSTNELNKESVKDKVELSIRLAKISSGFVKEAVNFDKSKPASRKWSVEQKERIENVNFDLLLKELKDIDTLAVKQKVNLVSRVFTIAVDEEEKYFKSSDGGYSESFVPRVEVHGILTVFEQNDFLQRFVSYGMSGGFEILYRLNAKEKIVSEINSMKKILEEGRTPSEEKLDVILSPELCGIAAHESVGHPYEADRIIGREGAQAGESYLEKQSVGTKVGSEFASVSDDPTIPNSSGFYLVDDEGIEARKRELIKDGYVKELLHNRETAYSFRTLSNGSARASSFDREPIVRMANTYVEPGDYSFDEMVKEVKNGVYIKSFMEWNIDDKRYNQRYVGMEAYAIVNGELSYPLRAPVLEITTPKLWGSMSARTKELEFQPATCGKGDPMQGIPVWHGGPHALLKQVMIKRR